MSDLFNEWAACEYTAEMALLEARGIDYQTVATGKDVYILSIGFESEDDVDVYKVSA